MEPGSWQPSARTWNGCCDSQCGVVVDRVLDKDWMPATLVSKSLLYFHPVGSTKVPLLHPLKTMEPFTVLDARKPLPAQQIDADLEMHVGGT